MKYRKIAVMDQSVLTAKLPHIKTMQQFSHGKMLNVKTYMYQVLKGAISVKNIYIFKKQSTLAYRVISNISFYCHSSH